MQIKAFVIKTLLGFSNLNMNKGKTKWILVVVANDTIVQMANSYTIGFCLWTPKWELLGRFSYLLAMEVKGFQILFWLG